MSTDHPHTHENGHVEEPPKITPESLYETNCVTVSKAIEDMHHRNLANMALLDANQGVTVDPHELLSIKFELLLEVVTAGDRLRRLEVGFFFQQKLSEHIADLKAKAEKSADTNPKEE